MQTVAQGAVAVVALIHGYIFVLESFLWTRPFGRRAFGMDEAFAKTTSTLAVNQGVYNAFLAAGLVFALVRGGGEGRTTALFFLACVAIAGVVGALTAKRIILYIQTVPAVL